MKKYLIILFAAALLCLKSDALQNENSLPPKEIFTVDNYYHTYSGLKDEKGKILLKPVYYLISEYEGLYYAFPQPAYAVYSMQGRKILDIKDASIEYYGGNFAVVRDADGCYLRGSHGEKLSKHYKALAIEPYFEKTLLFWETGDEFKEGVMNFKGKILAEPKKGPSRLVYAFPADDGGILAVSAPDKTFYLIDKKGNKKKISDEEYSSYSNEYENKMKEHKSYFAADAFSKNADNEEITVWGINSGNDNVIQNKYEKTSIASGISGTVKYFGFKENNLWGVKTIEDEKTVLSPVFKQDIKIVNNYILVNKAPKFSIFDKNFNKIFESFEIEGTGSFKESLIPAYKEDKFKNEYGFINKKGETAIDFKYRFVQPFSEGLAAAANHKELWGYINEKGETVIDFKYDYAEDFKNGRARDD